MNKIITLSLAIASAIAFEGCATSSSVRVTEINSYSHTQSASIRSNGAANMQTIGPVFVKTDDRCTISDVIKATAAKYPNASDLVNLRMEETSVQSGSNTTYSCKYSALAVNYKSISPEELWAWKALFASDTATADIPVEEPVVAPAAPAEEDQPKEATSAAEQPAETTTYNDPFYTR